MNSNPPRLKGEKGVVKSALSGPVICGKCGRKMTRRPYGKSGYPDTLLCQSLECNNVSEHLHLVEKAMLDVLREWLTRDVFTAARAKCDDEIAELTRLIDSIDKQKTIIKQQNDLIIDISNAINEIVEGMTYEDEFYRNLLDRMVVHDKDHIDVYLNLLPHKWSYTVAKAKMPQDDETLNRNISDNDIGTEELGH